MIILSRLADLHQHPSTFWSITLQPLVAGQATIQKMTGDINSFHMRHKGFIYYKRQQSFQVHKPLVQFRLVQYSDLHFTLSSSLVPPPLHGNRLPFRMTSCIPFDKAVYVKNHTHIHQSIKYLTWR